MSCYLYQILHKHPVEEDVELCQKQYSEKKQKILYANSFVLSEYFVYCKY